MNKKVLFAAFAVVFAALSCSKKAEPVDNTQEPEVIVPQQEVLVPYTLTAGAPPTRTAIDDYGNVVWSEDDAIKVYFDGGYAVSSEIELASGGASATFTVMLPDGMASSDKLYAVYPATTGASLSGSTFSIVVPEEQTGKFEDVNIVVAATTVGEHTLSFKQVLSFVNFTVSAGNPKAITRALFKDLYGTAIVGTLPVTFDDSGVATPGTATSTGTEVSLTAVQEGKNYIAVLPGVALQSIGLKLCSSSAWFTPIASDNDVTIERGHSKPLGTVDTKVSDAYYIKATASGNEDGTSWANAGDATLVSGLLDSSSDFKAASLAFKLDGFEIRVAEGSYELDLSIAPSSPTTFSLKGGYASDGTANSASLATFTGNDSHRIAWISDNQNANISFENIHFTHGNISNDHGGALKILGGSHAFSKCTFTLNQNAGGSKGGGAIYMNPGTSNTDKTITISNCMFGGEGSADAVKNLGNDMGSALCLFNCVATVSSTNFLNNSFPNAKQYSDKLNGAAVYIGDRMDATFSDCDFKWNYGGAFRLSGSTALDGRKVTMNNCFFWKNTCNYWGGGIHTDSPIPLFLNKCKFNGNKGNGHGGHISQYGNTSFIGINNCAFYKAQNTMNNTADAGDVWLDGKSVVANSSIVGPGGVIVLRYSDYYDGSVLVNSMVYPENSGSGYWGTPRFSTSGKDVVAGSYNLIKGVTGMSACYSSTTDKQTGSSYATFSSIGGTGIESTVTLDYTFTTDVPNPTLAQVETAIKGEATHGTDFYNWLLSVDGVAKDAYGNTRSDANNRPGALVK